MELAFFARRPAGAASTTTKTEVNDSKRSGETLACAACHGSDQQGTRLSKTPMDRTLDFSGLDFGKLKKAGFRSKVVKVAAGRPIGCDTCHRLDLTFTGSPGR